jgi:RND superfamily putative drug exporter
VTGRAPLWLAAGLLLLVALALPALHLSSSVNVQTTSSLPHNSSVRQAYDQVAAEFGPGASSPVLVVVDSAHASQVAHVVAADSREVAATSTRTIGDGRSLVVVTGKSAPYTPEARALVENLRSGSLHRNLAGIDYQVGGETATSVDATGALFGSLPLITCLVLVLVAAVLVGALRSVLLPIKAVVLVVLSLVATLGSLVLLTTTDFGSKLLGLGGPTDIQPFVPVTVVAIVLALSTDYEVILISRIREEFQKSRDNTASVVEGLARTGPVISSAGATMIAIFGSFALADLPVLKQLGVALALSVLLDAVLVRAILVPASMKLLGGRWNWWRPSLSLARGRALEEPT